MGEVGVRDNGDVGGESSMLPGQGPCTHGGAEHADGGWSPSLRQCKMFLNVTGILQAGRERLQGRAGEVEGGRAGGAAAAAGSLRVLFSEEPGADPVELQEMPSRRCLMYRVVDVSGLVHEGRGRWGAAHAAAVDAGVSCPQKRAEADPQRGVAEHQRLEEHEDLSSRSALLCGVGPLGTARVEGGRRGCLLRVACACALRSAALPACCIWRMQHLGAAVLPAPMPRPRRCLARAAFSAR